MRCAVPVSIACPSCKAKLKAPDALVGKNVKCPGCGKPVLVKAPAPAAVPAGPKADPAPIKKKLAKVSPPAEDFDDAPVEDSVEEKRPAAKARRRVEEPEDDVESVEESPRKGKGKAAQEEPGGPTNQEERTQAMLLHLFLFVPMVSPWLTLIWWLMKRKESRFVDHHGKEWLNFTITLMAVFLACGLVLGVSAGIGGYLIHWALGVALGVLLALIMLALGIGSFVLTIMAALKAKNGIWYRFPYIYRLIK